MKLERPLVFFDLETTGVDPVGDRIVQIGVSKMIPDGTTNDVRILVNPERPIPPTATEIHGIKDEDVVNAETFKQMAPKLYKSFKGCDLAGFNIIRFDVPMLAEHFLREGIDYPEKDTKFVDAMKIFHLKNPRDLAAAFKFYCGKELEGAHDALNDVIATRETFFSQLEKHSDIGSTVAEIDKYCFDGNKPVDFAGKLAWDGNGEIYYTFGKWKGLKVLHDFETREYARWMLRGEFSEHTKKILRELIGDKLYE